MAGHQEAAQRETPTVRGLHPQRAGYPPCPTGRTGNVNNPRRNRKQEERTCRPRGPSSQNPPGAPETKESRPHQMQTPGPTGDPDSQLEQLLEKLLEQLLEIGSMEWWNWEMMDLRRELNGNNKLKPAGPPNPLRPNLTQQCPLNHTLFIYVAPLPLPCTSRPACRI